MASKTLALILDYNFPEISEPLYESLLPYVDETHDLAILDNCSPPERRSKYAKYVSPANDFFTGGLNQALKIVQENPQYDSLLFITNDITIDTLPLVQPMRQAMFDGGFHWVGASVNEPPHGTHWAQTRPYGATEPRECLWFDLQCTLFHRELVEAIGAYDMVMKYGWGPDIYTGMVVEDHGWKAAMLDTVQVTHAGHNNTMAAGRSTIDENSYTSKAHAGMEAFFLQSSERWGRYHEFRFWANTYRYPN